MRKLLALGVALVVHGATAAASTTVLFVGNSYTFGRVDPVMSYNAGKVNDLTYAMWLANPAGSNAFEPHPWGGVPGIFERLTAQAGLDYVVSLSTRNAASLRGHFLNTNPAGWDLRGNIGAQTWDKVVLQEQSDEPLARRTNANGVALASNPEYFRFYADKIENFAHSTAASGAIRDRDAFPGATAAERQANCVAAGIAAGTCSSNRGSFANANASADTELFLYQTWARPNLVDGAYVTTTNADGSVTRSGTLSTGTFFGSLEEMTAELVASYQAALDQADNDGSKGFVGIAPVGEAFMLAVQAGLATRDMWAADALSDGLIDLWFDDGTHASKYGSYLSALVLFGELTGLDPAMFGAGELAAQDLGISAREARLLQRVASVQLGHAAAIPTPGTWSLFGLALVLLVSLRGRATRPAGPALAAA